MFVMVCEVGMSMWSTAAATAAVVSLRRLVLLHFTRLSFLQVSAQLPPRSNLCPDVAPVLLSCSRKARPLCDLGSSIPAVLLHWRETAVEGALQGPRPTLIIVTRSATSTLLQRHVMHYIS